MKKLLLAFLGACLIFPCLAQVNYTWNGGTSSSWTISSNWTPNGVPGSADNVTVVAAPNSCNLSTNISIARFTISSGTVNLGGFVLTTSDNTSFVGGSVNNGTLSVSSGTIGITTLSNTTFASNAALNVVSGGIVINGGTYGGPVTLEQTGTGQTTGTGNAVFNGITVITNSGASNLRANGNMTFNAATTFNNTNSGYICLELVSGSTFNSALNLNSSSSGDIWMAWRGTTNFNGNIVLSNTGTGTIYFGDAASTAANLNAGFTISAGGAGFSSGRLYLQKFRQFGGTAQTLNLTGSAQILQVNSIFNGVLNVSAANILDVSTCTFNAAVTISKTGGTGQDYLMGNNVFNSTLTVNHSGGGHLYFGNLSPDVYNGDIYLNNASAAKRISIGFNSSNNLVNGNVYVSSSSGQGIDVGNAGNFPVLVFGNGKSVFVNGAYTGGYLNLYRTSQSDATAITLSTTGTSQVILRENVFQGAVSVTAPDIFPYGGTYNSSVNFVKTGGGVNNNSGLTNIFNSSVSIDQQSNSGSFTLGHNSPDFFGGDITVTSSGNGGINLGSGNGLGTPSLAVGKSVFIGAGGFSSGSLQFNRFTQMGNVPMNFTFTGNNTSLIFAFNSLINGDINANVPNVFFNGTTFNGSVNCVKTSSLVNTSNGGNTFNAPFNFTNSGSGVYYFGNGNADTWNADAEFSNTGSSRIHTCWSSAGNQFNGNIYVNSTGSSTGIQFGGNLVSTMTLTAGKTIQVGSGGYTAGYLILQRFTQLGSTPISLSLAPTAGYFSLGPLASIGGNFSITAPSVFNISQTVFNGNLTCFKTGAGNDAWSGGNVFNGTSTFTNSGSGILYLGNIMPDIFNSDVEFTSNGTSRISPAWGSNGNLFNGDITLNSTGSSVGIFFSGASAAATATLAAGKAINLGIGGFTSGYLLLPRFTQLGSTPITLSMASTANYFSIGPNSNIGGNFSVIAPSIADINTTNFGGSFTCLKTGAGVNTCGGGNLFNGACSFSNTGSGDFNLGNLLPDTWNADVEFTNIGSAKMSPAWGSAGNVFNGNITLNSTGSSFGISFCGGNASASATLAAGKNIQMGTGGFISGYLILQRFTQLGSAAITLSLAPSSNYFAMGPACSFGGNFSLTAPSITNIYQSTFNNNFACLKTGAVSNGWQGANLFNGPSSFTNASNGFLTLGNTWPDTWNGDVEFTSSGGSYITPGIGTAGNMFNGNITVNSTASSTGVYFSTASTLASCTLAAGKTIFIGSAGFTSGNLSLTRFTQLGNASINLSLSPGSGNLQYGPSSVFNGDVTSSSQGLVFSGTVFNNTLTAVKNGSSNDVSAGGNIFNGPVVISQTGVGGLSMGNASADQFNSKSEFINTGTGNMVIANNSSGNIFGGRARFTNTPASTAAGIFVASNVANNSTFNDSVVVVNVNGNGVFFGLINGTSTLTAGKKVTVGTGGFNSGTLLFRGFTQQGGTSQSFTTTGSSIIQYGPSSVFSGSLISVSPGLLLNGCNFGSSSAFVKNGAPNNYSNGSNVFNGPTDITNSGSGFLVLGNITSDQFNSSATFNNTGSNSLYIAYNSTGNVFSGPVTFNNSPTSVNSLIEVATFKSGSSTFNNNITVNNVNGAGIYFSPGSGTSSLSPGYSVTIGAGGFNSGMLMLRGFNQLGSTDQNLTTTGTSTIQYGPSSSFGGNVTSTSPGLLFHGCVFSGSATCTKNGSSNTIGVGANVFNGPANITNSGSGFLMFGNGNGDQFNSSATFNNTGSGNFIIAYSCSNNVFSGPVTLNNLPTSTSAIMHVAQFGSNNTTFNDNVVMNNVNGGGIYFGLNGGTCTLTAGKTISIGASGFNSGSLYFRAFTQLGAGNLNFTSTGSSTLNFGPGNSFDANIISSNPSVFFMSSTFNGTVNFTKTGAATDQSWGNNVFNNSASFTNNGTGAFMFGNWLGDVYNGDVSYIQNSTGAINPSYNTNCTYAGNISVSSPSTAPIMFGSFNGTTEFVGSSSQSINKTPGSADPVFKRFTMSKTSNTLTLNTRININLLMTLNTGIIATSSANVLVMNNGAATTIGNASSYIHGPMYYDMAFAGSRTLNFPIGKNGDWRPAVLTVAHNNGTSYTYNSEVFSSSAQTFGWTLPASVDQISNMHYWDIQRINTLTGASTPSTNLSGNQTITLYYDNNDGVGDPANLVICKTSAGTPTTSWVNIGGAGATMSVGSVASTSAPSPFNSFSKFTLGNANGGTNVLPIQLISFDAEPVNGQVDLKWVTATEKNNDHFEVERSKDGLKFEKVFSVKAGRDGNYAGLQNYGGTDTEPYGGLSYYRLKQVDKTGAFSYAPIVWVNMDSNRALEIYPNPTQDVLNFKVKSGFESVEVSLYGALGNLVIPPTALNSLNDKIDVSQLARGVYYLMFNHADLAPLKVVVE